MINIFHNLFTAKSPLTLAQQQLHATEMDRLEASRLAEYYNAMCDMLAERKDRLELYVETYGKTVAEIDALYTSKPIPTDSESIATET